MSRVDTHLRLDPSNGSGRQASVEQKILENKGDWLFVAESWARWDRNHYSWWDRSTNHENLIIIGLLENAGQRPVCAVFPTQDLL